MSLFSRREFLSGGSAWTGWKVLEALQGEETPRARPIIKIATDQPYVCVALDDGYSSWAVERFLTIAVKYQTQFTVFPVGTVLLKNPSLWQEVKAAGHEIGNHSHDHIMARGKTKGQIRASFSSFEAFDYPEVFGEAFPVPGLARVPYAEGPVNQFVQEVIYELGDYHVHWLRDSYSWQKSGADTVKNRKFALDKILKLGQGELGVMHFNALDMAILPALLEGLAEKGLVNVTFSQLFASRTK